MLSNNTRLHVTCWVTCSLVCSILDQYNKCFFILNVFVSTQVTQLFRLKWLNFFSQCTERKNWVLLTLKVESLAEPKFDPNFYFKMTHFLAQSTERKKKWVILTLKVESVAVLIFDPKSWVTGGTKIWPNFLGQNDSIFLLVHR